MSNINVELVPQPDQIGDSVPNLNLSYSSRHAGYIIDWQRLRRGPWHNFLVKEGAHVWDVYNKMYHARQIIPGREGLLKELDHLLNGVTMWGVHVERQIQVKGSAAAEFVDYVVSRDIEVEVPPGSCKYVILCDQQGGIINDPVLLRPTENEFWFSISDSDVELWLKGLLMGLNAEGKFLTETGEPAVQIQELKVAPVQIQGPKAPALMKKLFGEQIIDMPYYSMQDNTLNGLDVTISRTGFSNVPGFEIYLHDAYRYALNFWYYIKQQGEEFGLQVIAPSHIQRLATGILSWGQDMTLEHNPYESRLGWQIDRPHHRDTGELLTDKEVKKKARAEGKIVYRPKDKDFVGKDALVKAKKTGITTRLVGLKVRGRKRFMHYDDSRDYLHVYTADGKTFVGYVTSIFWHPTVGSNIAFARISTHYLDMKADGIHEDTEAGTEFKVLVPSNERTADEFGNVRPDSLHLANAVVSKVPFKPKEASGDLKKYVK